MITPGDIDDRKPLEYKAFIDLIYGKLFGDKGYIGKNLFQTDFHFQYIAFSPENIYTNVSHFSTKLLYLKLLF